MSQAQRSSPVMTSKPWITPDGAQRRCPSRTWWPVTTTPRTITGADVIDTMPGETSPMPTVMSTWPLSPKSAHGLPVRASTAIRRASSVPSMMRVAHGALAASGVRGIALEPAAVMVVFVVSAVFAVPVWNENGRVVAALVLAGPQSRLPEVPDRSLRIEVIDAAAELVETSPGRPPAAHCDASRTEVHRRPGRNPGRHHP